jgi:hypothetical protein
MTPVKLALLIALAVLGACAHPPSRQDSWRVAVDERQVEVAVRYAPVDDPAARQVERVLRSAVAHAERWARLSAPLTITIHATHAALEAAANRPDHPWLRAWARPEGSSCSLRGPGRAARRPTPSWRSCSRTSSRTARCSRL